MIEALPREVGAKVLSFLSRWCGVRCAQCVSRTWRRQCRRAEFASIILVTASKLNAVFVFGESGELRCRIPAMPWKRASRLDVCGEKRRKVELLKPSKSQRPLWPTCTVANARRLFVSQYRVCGVLVFSLDDRALLVYDRTIAAPALDYPEGLALYGGLLLVATCCGTVASVDAAAGVVLRTISYRNSVFWNVTFVRDRLYLAAHCVPLDAFEYTEPTALPGGFVLRCAVDPNTGDISFDRIITQNSLNRPSGIACLGDDLLVTTFLHSSPSAIPHQPNWRRGVLRIENFLDDTANFPIAASPFDAVPPASRPWGIAVQRRRHGPDLVWLCGHGLTLTALDLGTGHHVVNAKTHPSVGASTKKEHYVIHHPDKAHTNVVLVV